MITRSHKPVFPAFASRLVAALLLVAGTHAVRLAAQSMPFGGHKENLQLESDPWQGDWEGQWGGGRDIVAMVIARGDGNYDVRFQDYFDERTAPYTIAHAHVESDTLKIDDGDWQGVFTGDAYKGRGHFRDDQFGTITMHRIKRESPTLGAKPPPGAIVLFDGSSFDEWESTGKSDSRIDWRLVGDGSMEVGVNAEGNGHSLRTRRKFRDVRLHVEFRLPLLPRNTGQGRGNSGVFVQGYETQVLDSYGLEGYNNECGALYKFKAPLVNMCYPPLQWQTYDIFYRAARFDASGAILAKPRITVLQNGVVIQRDVELSQDPVVKDGVVVRPPMEAEPIMLQFHASRVRYRNIWVVDLGQPSSSD